MANVERIMMFGSHDALLFKQHKELMDIICDLIMSKQVETIWDNSRTGVLQINITGSLWESFEVNIEDLRHNLYIRTIGRIPYFIDMFFSNDLHIGVFIKYIKRSEKPIEINYDEAEITVETVHVDAPDDEYIFA